MGARERRRARGGAPGGGRAQEPAVTGSRDRPPSRSERRDAAARARLTPLAPGEVPTAVRVGAAVALTIAVANLGFLAAGWEVRGRQPSTGGVVAFSALMLAAAAFMWKGRYWAVLGFQCLLALSAVVAGLSLMLASNVQGAILSVAILTSSGTLFWFLVKAMARLQMPERPGHRGT